jgi:tetratricopeptide (TPR) repeat protein
VDERGGMKKNVALLVFLALTGASVAPGWVAKPITQHSGLSMASGEIAAAGEDLAKLLPRTITAVIVLDLERVMEVDAIVKAMEDPEFKKGYDEFVKASGIDPKRDVTYVSISGVGASEYARQPLMSTGGYPVNTFTIVINLKYDKARLQGLIKEKAPKAKEEMYSGVAVYSNLDDEDEQTTPYVLAELGDMSPVVALLDPSHIVCGFDKGVKGIIDVYQKKAEPLAKNPEMTALLSRVDKSGIAWCACSFPPELIKKVVDSNPQLKALEAFKGITMAIDDNNSTLVADLRVLGGTREHNVTGAANLNALKAMLGEKYAAQEPAFGELLNGIAMTSGEDDTRLTLTASHEIIGKLWRLAEPKDAEWQALSMESWDFYRNGNYERALEVGKQALELAEKNVGPDHPDVAAVRSWLAYIDIDQHQYAEAEQFSKRALATVEKALGPHDPRVAAGLDQLATLYLVQGKFAQAEALYKRSLTIREKAFGPDHLFVAESLDDLARLYRTQGRHSEAEPLFKRALAIRENVLGLDDPLVAKSLDALGLFYYTQGRHAEAEPLFKRALAIMEKTLVQDDPYVVTILLNMARLYRATNREKEAEALEGRAARIQAIKR